MTTLTPSQPVGSAENLTDEMPSFPLVSPLRLNLAALGVDGDAPDFGERLCLLSRDNECFQFEYSAKGELISLPPTGAEGGHGEQGVNYAVFGWGLDNPGRTYPQTTLFKLPSGAQYMPDAAWISQERFENLTALEQRGSINGAPDFLIELHSHSNGLRAGLAKMEEWMDAGAKLGWYIQPYQRRVYLYRAGREVEILDETGNAFRRGPAAGVRSGGEAADF